MQTNDSEQPTFNLVVTGKVVKFVEVRPAQVRLEGDAGTPLTIDIEIMTNRDHPFSILGMQTKRDDFIRCELIEQCNSSTNRCVVRVENLKTTSGRYADTIIVQTDNSVKPNFPIPVVGIIH